MDARPARRPGLERRILRILRQLPPGQLLRLPDDHVRHRDHQRRRLCRLHDRARGSAGAGARGVVRRGGGAADVRRRHHLQLPAQQRRAGPATWWRCSAWADLAIWVSSLLRRWASRQWPSRAGRTRKRWPISLGAWRYIDNQAQDPAAELQKLGGAKVVLATVTAAMPWLRPWADWA